MAESMHLIADLTCPKGLDDAEGIESFMRQVIQSTGLTIQHFHLQEFKNGSGFGPGITGMALLSESHMVVHTAPERNTLNLDLFSCRPFSEETVEIAIENFFGVTVRQRWQVLTR